MTRSARALGARAPATARRARTWIFMAASLTLRAATAPPTRAAGLCKPHRLLTAAPPDRPERGRNVACHKSVTNPPTRAGGLRKDRDVPAQAAKSPPSAQLDAL